MEDKFELRNICNELAKVAYKSFKIGTQLSVPHHKLKEFEKEDDLLTSMIHYLLSNGTTGGVPLTWMAIAEALDSDYVGEHGLATSIRNKYCVAGETISRGTSASKQTSKETQTTMPLPSKLLVHVPVHCATIKATKSGFKPQGDDEKLTLAISVQNASNGMPLKCIVALDGDRNAPCNDGHVVCFLSLSVCITGEHQSRTSYEHEKTMYSVWRSKKSDYTPNGQATFYICFYEADANFIVTFDIDTVFDEDGIQCIGYKVEHYTGFISTVKTVERNAFKAPPLLKYEGSIASPKFNKLMSLYTKLFYQGKTDDSNKVVSKITSSDSTAALDVKLYLSISKATEKSFSPQTISQLEGILQQARSLESHNSFLLEALIMMSLSQVHCLQKRKEKALDCIHHSRSLCLEAAPSHLTSCVFFTDARNMITVNKNNITPAIKRRILVLFDRAIADSYYGIGWERLMIFNGHVYKALFCLNGMIDLHLPSSTHYVPTSEDISIAEQHLDAAPLDAVCDIHRHIVIYYIAKSDLYKCKGNVSEARNLMEKARDLCVEKSYFTSLIPALDKRLEHLQPDTVDEILELYKDSI